MVKLKLLEEPHPHPLTFMEGRINCREGMLCCGCNKELYPPAFICSTCNFYIHQSCIHLPPLLRSRFHPNHLLSHAAINHDHCHCCWQRPRDCIYTCSPCGFVIDIKCAISDTKQSGLQLVAGQTYQHFTHPHPLILEEQITGRRKLVVCHLCEMLLVSGPTYFCPICDIRFHKACAELPREKLHLELHPHPLFLFPHRWDEPFCHTCKNRCSSFVYNCVECDFNLHVTCLLSSHHKHYFTRFRNRMGFQCLLCGWNSYDFPWFCTICHLLAHKECAELPLSLRVVGHECSLSFKYSHPNNLRCEICRKKVEPQFAAYNCSKCSYVIHLSCAAKKMFEEVGAVLPFNGITSLRDGASAIHILDSNCEHELVLYNQEEEDGNGNGNGNGNVNDDNRCHGCMRHISAAMPYYGCVNCDLFLHKICADLPVMNWHLLHQHPLTLIPTQDVVFQCNACLQFCHGCYAYHCEECRFMLDIRCALTPTKQFKHPSHRHLLSLAQYNMVNQTCHGCGQSNNTVFECHDGCCSNFSLDYRCATLPLQARSRYDAHFLDLSFSAEDESGEYYCDVCEEERNPSVCFYHCKMCQFAVHIECVLGEYPWLKYGLYETHRHPLALVAEGKMNFSPCGHCGKSCAGNLAYECRRCKFNVHAVGQCYHKQILQGKIIFDIK
ncbi:uncharacterized protein LOC111022616 [Momordica charantia]|uniref:Uncharacterized protein LOC111022616 n=1 Tax=Momordica charantia TaxID=3673 RepID=A0A6J1DN61_MOMCH|nr:uncharacterized protein LOC111022616 [Momordica charantia]